MTRPSPHAQSAAPANRISADEALRMLAETPVAELMARADEVRRRLHGPRTYFVHSLNLNPTNVCENRCDLCAFWRDPDAADAYLVTLEQARERMQAARGWGLTDLHIVGGIRPELDLAYYESLLRMAGELLPGVLVQGLTAVEVHYVARQERLAVPEVLRRLKDAGLGAIPGGGAEIFADRVRQQICRHKISADQWLEVHEQAHAAGLATNATMLFGHVETPEEIVDHLSRLRAVQDRTGGFRAFVALPFHAEGTRLPVTRGPGGHTIARVVAMARLLLDNFPHVRVLPNYLDRKLLGVLACAGADDVGGTSLNERIARAAGAPESHRFASVEELSAFLADLSLEPVLVNSAYEPADEGAASARGTGILPVSPTGVPPVSSATGVPRGASPAAEWHVSAESRASAGKRLSAAEAVALYEAVPFARLGELAHRRRLAAVPGGCVTFVLDRNINVTNVCEAGCKFCAFHVAPGADGGFVLSVEQVLDKVVEAAEAGATQILLQGGLNPQLDLGYYEGLLAAIKGRVDVWLHSLSPAEVAYLAGRSGLSIAQTLARLRAAGLDSLPGGGAEILVDDVRRAVSPRKISADGWFEVMRAAHSLGMKTTATMVYGLGESPAQLVEHLARVRDLQDATGGFTAFIPWSFQPNRTQLAFRPRTGVDYLRVVALARLVLDNVPHLQAGWVTEGPGLAQLALGFGADDFGGVLMEESVVRATGVSYAVSAEQVVSLIREAGFTPAQRTTQYEILRRC